MSPRRSNTPFDVDLLYDFGEGNEDIRIEGEITPYYPAVMYLRNGDPGYPEEGGEIEDPRVFRIVDGKELEIEGDLAEQIVEKLSDAIYESVVDQ